MSLRTSSHPVPLRSESAPVFHVGAPTTSPSKFTKVLTFTSEMSLGSALPISCMVQSITKLVIDVDNKTSELTAVPCWSSWGGPIGAVRMCD